MQSGRIDDYFLVLPGGAFRSFSAQAEMEAFLVDEGFSFLYVDEGENFDRWHYSDSLSAHAIAWVPRGTVRRRPAGS